MSNFRRINFHPWNHNILDYVGKDASLVTADGDPVTIQQDGALFFTITIGDELYNHYYIDNAYYLLNSYEIGTGKAHGAQT